MTHEQGLTEFLCDVSSIEKNLQPAATSLKSQAELKSTASVAGMSGRIAGTALLFATAACLSLVSCGSGADEALPRPPATNATSAAASGGVQTLPSPETRAGMPSERALLASPGTDGDAGAQANRAQSPRLPQGFQLPTPIRPSSTLETVKSTTKEYLDRARAVTLAKCVGRRVDYGAGGNIYTFYTFEAEETIKGPERPTITIRLFGGIIGNTTIPLGIEPEFDVGTEYVVMLGPDNADGFATLNPAAVFTAKTEPESGRKVVVPGGNGITLYSKATGRPIASSPEWAFLDDFVYSLKLAAQ